MRMSKQGVILLNLGSPDSTQVSDVRKYLREFLMDGRVLDAPFAIRWFLVNCLILPNRPKQSAEAYSKIWLEDGSPLILTSKAQQKALSEQVDVPVALGMRYGSPSTESALQELLDQGVDDVLIVPMYPHYAMSSYETAVVHYDGVGAQAQARPQDHAAPAILPRPRLHRGTRRTRAPSTGRRQLRQTGLLLPRHPAASSSERATHRTITA